MQGQTPFCILQWVCEEASKVFTDHCYRDTYSLESGLQWLMYSWHNVLFIPYTILPRSTREELSLASFPGHMGTRLDCLAANDSRITHLVQINVVSLQPLQALLHNLNDVVPGKPPGIAVILVHWPPHLRGNDELWSHLWSLDQPVPDNDLTHTKLVDVCCVNEVSACLHKAI